MSDIEVDNCNIGCNKDADLEEEENYECIKQSKIDNVIANSKPLDDTENTTPIDETVANENYEMPLYNNNPIVKDEQDTLNENVMNETDIQYEY